MDERDAREAELRATIDDVRVLGYTVEDALTLAGVVVYRVEGYGVSTMVRADDLATIDSLADPAAHAERETQSLPPA